MDEEGQDFVHAFGQVFGNLSATRSRLKAERRAGMTSKQRARRAKKTATVNFRCSDAQRKVVEALASKLNTNFTGVMERAVALLATSENVGGPA
jgi:hypothetical protein